MSKFWQKKYTSKYTGAEIDAAVAKAGTVPTVTSADAGKILGVDSEGKIVAGDKDIFLVVITESYNDASHKYEYTYSKTATETRAAFNANKNVVAILSTGGTTETVLFNTGVYTFCRIDTQDIAEAQSNSKATQFIADIDGWEINSSRNFIIPGIAPATTQGLPVIYEGYIINTGTWSYSVDLSSMLESYIAGIKLATLMSQDGTAFLTTTLPKGAPSYDDLAWFMGKVFEIKAKMYKGFVFTFRSSDYAKAEVNYVSQNAFTAEWSEVEPVSGGTADIYEILLNFVLLNDGLETEKIVITLGAKKHTSTIYTPS